VKAATVTHERRQGVTERRRALAMMLRRMVVGSLLSERRLRVPQESSQDVQEQLLWWCASPVLKPILARIKSEDQKLNHRCARQQAV
jgi:hypothetical protein